MTLQAELEQILQAYASIDGNEIGEDRYDGHHDTAMALQAILAAVSKHLPEKIGYVKGVKGWQKIWEQGFNTAITEMEKTLGADHEWLQSRKKWY